MPRSQLLREGSEERTTATEQLRRGMAGGVVGGVSGSARSAAEQWGQAPRRWGRDRENQQPPGGDTLQFGTQGRVSAGTEPEGEARNEMEGMAWRRCRGSTTTRVAYRSSVAVLPRCSTSFRPEPGSGLHRLRPWPSANASATVVRPSLPSLQR